MSWVKQNAGVLPDKRLGLVLGLVRGLAPSKLSLSLSSRPTTRRLDWIAGSIREAPTEDGIKPAIVLSGIDGHYCKVL